LLINYHDRYEEHKGKIEKTRKGSLVSSCSGQTTAHALQGIEPRGVLFIGANTKVYEGMVIGEHNRDQDLDVNAVRAKQLSNMRTVFKEDAIRLIPPKERTLEEIMSYIQGIILGMDLVICRG
jgi:GTP-binding protein